MKKYFYNVIPLIVLLFLIVPNIIYAQDNGGGGAGGGAGNGGGGSGGSSGVVIKLENPFGNDTNLFDFIKKLVNDIILPLGGMLAVLAFIYSGFLYVTAQGDQGKIAKAHKALLYTAIGTAILLGAVVIANAVKATIDQLR